MGDSLSYLDNLLSADIICSEKRTVFRELEENCELRGTNNAQGQICEHIFEPSGGCCVYYLSNIFATLAVLKIVEYHSDIPQF